MKINSLIILFIFVSCLIPKLFAQEGLYPDIVWEKTYGGTQYDGGGYILQLDDHSFLILGGTSSSNGDVSLNHGVSDIWIIIIDSVGNLLWERAYGGPYSDGGSSLIKTFDNGYFFSGTIWASGGDIEEIYEDYDKPDIWGVKIDSSGNIKWEDNFGWIYFDFGSDAIQTIDSGFVVFGETSYSEYGQDDILIEKRDATGNFIFEETYGGSDFDYGSIIREKPDSTLIFTGTVSSNDSWVSGNHGGQDAWVVQLDKEGELIWQKCLGGTGNEGGGEFIFTDDGGMIFLFGSNSTDGDVTENHGDYDIWVVKTDSLANIEWQKSYGGNNRDSGRKIVKAEDGYIITAQTNSWDGDVSYNPFNYYTSWVFKIDFYGNIMWEHTYGGSGIDGAGEVIILDTGYLVVGSTWSDDGDVAFNHGVSDLWVYQLSEPCNHTRYFVDADGDGYGNVLVDIFSCDPVIGYVLDSTDCDDNNNLIHPGALDLCNGIDENCNGELDEDAEYFVYYIDADGDGFGNEIIDTISCADVPGYTLAGGDCNDANSAFNPDAFDDCDGFDQNCNGLIDEDATYVLYYADSDGDGFGNADSHVLYCATPDGYVSDSTDCDDTNENIYPGATELLNGLDDNCDGIIDEGLSISTLAQNTINLYPNPANTEIHIEHDLFITAIITRNNLGEEITIEFINDVADISALPPGIYFSEIRAQEGIVIVSWVKN